MTETEKNWGGARTGAGRPRTETLDTGELALLLKLLTESPYAGEYADTIGKLRRMAEKERRN
jgi:hypothetical protein